MGRKKIDSEVKSGPVIYTNKCIRCGEEFQTTNSRAKLCSPVCTGAYNSNLISGKPMKQTCKVCGEVFYKEAPSPFCSAKCRNKRMEKKIKKPKDSLGKKLEYCRKHGISYSEYQQQETMKSLRMNPGRRK